MNIRLCWQIATRFQREHRKSGYLSFMSSSAIFGIALGCFVLIMLLSIMNGFEKELRNTLLAVIPHGEIFSVSNSGIENWQTLQSSIEQDKRVKFATPYTQITGLLQHKTQLKPVALSGLPVGNNEVAQYSTAVAKQAFKQLQDTPNGVILGAGIAKQLDIGLGDLIDFLIPPKQTGNTLAAPTRVQFEIVGLFAMGGEVDTKIGLINLTQASELLGIESGVQGIRLTMHNPFDAKEVVREHGYYLNQTVYMSDWTRTHGHIFQDIQLVRSVVYVVLTLVIAVACFNVVSTLVMSVKAKQASIAILISMGASTQFIRRVFLLQGLTNGIVGTAIGCVLALVLVPKLSAFVSALENVFGTKLLSADVYFIDFLPTAMQLNDILLTVSLSLLLSLISSYYPARRAAMVQPAQALT